MMENKISPETKRRRLLPEWMPHCHNVNMTKCEVKDERIYIKDEPEDAERIKSKEFGQIEAKPFGIENYVFGESESEAGIPKNVSREEVCVVEDDDSKSGGKNGNCFADRSSSNAKKRQNCEYGAQCYRKNGEHKKEFCHPGDQDYEAGQSDTQFPECIYGTSCYRKNSNHRKQFKHTGPPKNGSTFSMQSNNAIAATNRSGQSYNSLNINNSEEYSSSSDSDIAADEQQINNTIPNARSEKTTTKRKCKRFSSNTNYSSEESENSSCSILNDSMEEYQPDYSTSDSDITDSCEDD